MKFDDDPELTRVLREWRVPDAPDRLRPRMPGRPAWRRLMSARVRLPLPVAVVLSVAMIWLAVLVARDRTPAAQTPPAMNDLHGFQPVTSINVRIERRRDGAR